MRSLVRLVPLVVIATGCIHGEPDPRDVVGPYTGATHRYVVDGITLPTSSSNARDFGADLNGDTTVDNQLGMVIGTLAGQGDVTSHGADMIAAGAIASTIEIVADDLRDDDTVSVRYLGADGDAAGIMGGRFVDGAFTSNRTATTRVPGFATVRLPVFVDADPLRVEVTGMEMLLSPDGRGGFDGYVHGTVATAKESAYPGIVQMIANDPHGHYALRGILDANADHTITYDEFAYNGLIMSLLAPDVTLDGRTLLSFGFAVHLAPCASGRCAAAIADPCFDRVLDGDESDRDCGGGCGGCVGEAQCTIAADCETNACETNGRCRAPSCTDGVADGYETDVDCGDVCGKCDAGEACWDNLDCASGLCGTQCTDTDPYGCIHTGLQTCQ